MVSVPADRAAHIFTSTSPTKKPFPGPARPTVPIARVYGLEKASAYYVLVDRLWPRCISKQTAPFDEWARDVAPSAQLRKWYGHDPALFEELAQRYRAELAQSPARDAFEALQARARCGPVVLVTATKETTLSCATVLAAMLVEAAPASGAATRSLPGRP